MSTQRSKVADRGYTQSWIWTESTSLLGTSVNKRQMPLIQHASLMCSSSLLPYSLTKYSSRVRPASAVANPLSVAGSYLPQLPSGVTLSHTT